MANVFIDFVVACDPTEEAAEVRPWEDPCEMPKLGTSLLLRLPCGRFLSCEVIRPPTVEQRSDDTSRVTCTVRRIA